MHKLQNTLTALALAVLFAAVAAAQQPANPDREQQQTRPQTSTSKMQACHEQHTQMQKAVADIVAVLSEGKDSTDASELKATLDDVTTRATALKQQMDAAMADCQAAMNTPTETSTPQAAPRVSGQSGQGAVGTSGQTTATRTLKFAMSEEEVKDVCGDRVTASSAPRSTYHGQTYYFCSDADKIRFDANPEEFIKR